MPASNLPPTIDDPAVEMLTYSGYCPLNRHKNACRKKGRRITRPYDNEKSAREKVLFHLTNKKYHGMEQIEAVAALANDPTAIWVTTCLKSTWDEGVGKRDAAKPAKGKTPEVPSSDGELQAGQRSRLEAGVASIVADKRRPRSPSRPRSRSSRSRPRRPGPPPRSRPPPAPGVSAHVACAAAPPAGPLELAASLGPAGRFVNQYQHAAAGMWPSRDINSSPKEVLVEALIRSEMALRSAALMARSASQAFEDAAQSLAHSKLAFAMDRHKHQSSYVQFI